MYHAQTNAKGVFRASKAHFIVIDEDFAFILLVDTHQDIHQGCLSCAVLPYQGQDFTLSYVQAYAIAGQDSGKAFGDVFHPEGLYCFTHFHLT